VWECTEGESGTYFTEILTSAGGKAKSAYAHRTCGDE
jgi:hypothetical protein